MADKPLDTMTLAELQSERAFWDEKIRTAGHWGGALTAAEHQRDACDVLIERLQQVQPVPGVYSPEQAKNSVRAMAPTEFFALATAPKDGTIVILQVRPTEEAWTPFDDNWEAYVTIGFNHLKDTGEDAWQFAGWDWNQDCFVDGHGEVLGWLPLTATMERIQFLENENGSLRHKAATASIGHDQLNRLIRLCTAAGAPRELHFEDQVKWLAERQSSNFAAPEGIWPAGTPVVKTSGYPFPGKVAATFNTSAGQLRYVIEATGPDYAGMLHIFSPYQLAEVTRPDAGGQMHA